jgi:hypothetical protein
MRRAIKVAIATLMKVLLGLGVNHFLISTLPSAFLSTAPAGANCAKSETALRKSPALPQQNIRDAEGRRVDSIQEELAINRGETAFGKG